MTRLKESDINLIETHLRQYEGIFMQQTGYSLEEIAQKAAGFIGIDRLRKTAVVPITSGLGIIGGFSKTVVAILRHCGVDSFATEKTDVAGIQEAFLTHSELVFLADDNVCAAIGVGSSVMADNGWSTGQGFATALVEAMKKRGVMPKGERVLIVGAGPVGRSAANYLSNQQAIPYICDLDESKALKVADTVENVIAIPVPARVNSFTYIIDATTTADYITSEDVSEKSIISAPGMPCGITAAARDIATVIHNPLELGIMTMYFDCMRQIHGLSALND